MTTIYDVEIQELVEKTAVELKKIPEIKPPAWSGFVKTGMSKQRPPVDKDWWYMRSASVLRTIYRLGPIGTSKLRTKYGGKKNRGVKKEHSYKGSGSIIRKVMQQLEKAGFVKLAEKGVHKGRIVTPKGTAFLHDVASSIQGSHKESMVDINPVKEEPKDKPAKKQEKKQVE